MNKKESCQASYCCDPIQDAEGQMTNLDWLYPRTQVFLKSKVKTINLREPIAQAGGWQEQQRRTLRVCGETPRLGSKRREHHLHEAVTGKRKICEPGFQDPKGCGIVLSKFTYKTQIKFVCYFILRQVHKTLALKCGVLDVGSWETALVPHPWKAIQTRWRAGTNHFFPFYWKQIFFLTW